MAMVLVFDSSVVCQKQLRTQIAAGIPAHPLPPREANVHGAKAAQLCQSTMGASVWWGETGVAEAVRDQTVLQVKLCSEWEQRQLPLTPQDFSSSDLGSDPLH